MPVPVCPPPPPAPWRHYPYTPSQATDPAIVFPGAEGNLNVASDTYYASGFLHGTRSGRRYAFLTIFVKNEEIFDLLSADLHVLALFNLDTGEYDTGSRFDLPPVRALNADRINVTRGRLDVNYHSARRVSRISTRVDASGALQPFAYMLDLSAEARSGVPMALSLCADALKPPQLVGAAAYDGRITVYGQPNTGSYYQSLAYRGTLRWGEIEEPVEGGIGWLDRQWFPEYAGQYAGLLADRFGHQWAQVSLDNGWEFSLWRQFNREQDDRLVAFSGLTATDPAGATRFIADATVDTLSYVRDPERIEPLLADLQRLAGRRDRFRWLFDCFRLRAPSLRLDLTSTPLVATPAHYMPIDYFSGPTRLDGWMDGRPVEGFGFHERTLPLSSSRQLVLALHGWVTHLPDEAFADSLVDQEALTGLTRETERLIETRQPLAALAFLDDEVRPALAMLAEHPRAALLQLVDDLARQIAPFA